MTARKDRNDLQREVREAIKHFWRTRDLQAKAQGQKSGKLDVGARSAVTGGTQLAGFAKLFHTLLVEEGIPDTAICYGNKSDLPGFFRAEKKWDLVVVSNNRLLAAVEFKAHIGPSFGNNFNNRTEEAIGSAVDFWEAYRHGAFGEFARPWLGYMMLLEDAPESRRPVSASESHFPILEEFRKTSYVQRYDILLKKMVRERFYDAAALLLTHRDTRDRGDFSEPSSELTFVNFVANLMGRIIAFLRFQSYTL